MLGACSAQGAHGRLAVQEYRTVCRYALDHKDTVEHGYENNNEAMSQKRSRNIILEGLGVAAVIILAETTQNDDDCVRYQYRSREECAKDWGDSRCEPHDGYYYSQCTSGSSHGGGGVAAVLRVNTP